MNNIEKAAAFLREQFENSAYLKLDPAQKNYRLEHAYRVANLCRLVAEKEGLDAEGLAIGGLLHDVSYREPMDSQEAWQDHGRTAARIARPFLETLDLTAEQVQEICYGIAVHVDDKADFPGENTVFARTIGDCDNLDRYDAYRIYETLENDGYSKLSLEEKKKLVERRLEGFSRCLEMELATRTASEIWQEEMKFAMAFYERLQKQLENSRLL